MGLHQVTQIENAGKVGQVGRCGKFFVCKLFSIQNKISSQNFVRSKKVTKKDLSTLRFFKFEFFKRIFFYYYKNLRVDRPSLVPFLLSHKFLLDNLFYMDKSLPITYDHFPEKILGSD